MIKSAESRERDWWVRLFCFVLVMNKYKLSYCTSPLDKICKSYFDIRAGGYRVLNAETFMSALQLKYSELPWWLSGKESACNAGDPGSIPGLGRSPGEGNGNPLQCSCLENSMDRGAWRAAVHRITKSRTRLSN